MGCSWIPADRPATVAMGWCNGTPAGLRGADRVRVQAESGQGEGTGMAPGDLQEACQVEKANGINGLGGGGGVGVKRADSTKGEHSMISMG